MSPVWTTFITSMLSTLAVPYLEKKYGLKLEATQQAAITAGAVGALTASAHWLHTSLFSRHKHR
jgi:hypothetical protein